MIPVTKTFLPQMEEYTAYLEDIWESGWVTNRGKLVLRLEDALRKYLEVEKIIITNNGTVPLQIAIKALELEGEVITTPFSYIATTSAILWQKCIPRFVDIDPLYLTIDENLIEEAITPSTCAILATHVFGNPCNVEAIAGIAEKHGLPVIYDAAHCFGVKYKNRSIFNYGDVSTCSFHATKIFHTGEGGAMFCNDESLFHKLYYSHNFGHNGPVAYHGLGINGKISELQAAMGLAMLPHMDAIIKEREGLCRRYDELLKDFSLQTIRIRNEVEWNYSYYPVIFESEKELLEALGLLNAAGIYPRRYFYPSLSSLDFIGKHTDTPVSGRTAESIMCLPLYIGLLEEDQVKVVSIVHKVFGWQYVE
jgi:dTDP-4-amino-4,6-dideoxygalactose transaminase